jgi:hypothetical protein
MQTYLPVLPLHSAEQLFLWGLCLHQRHPYTVSLYVPWTSLVLTYTPLVVALLVPVRGTFVMGKSILFARFTTVITDHLNSFNSVTGTRHPPIVSSL